MLRLRFVLIGLMAVSCVNAVAADPFGLRAKARRSTSLATAASSSNDSYYVPYVMGPGGAKYPIMEVPGSATVVSRKLMDDQQAVTLGDAPRNVSGVTVRGRQTKDALSKTSRKQLRSFASSTIKHFSQTQIQLS